jgi:hypothetical protein
MTSQSLIICDLAAVIAHNILRLFCCNLQIGLHHPLDGITNPEYKLLRFIQLTNFFCKEKKALAFNLDRCCHLALCLWLILFH